MIEHVAEHEQVLAEIARVLAPGGLLAISTPERRAYSDERDFTNPYHARELTQEEFTALLRAHFPSVALFAQQAVAGSRLEALSPARAISPCASRAPATTGRRPGAGAAVSGRRRRPTGRCRTLPGESTLIDYGLEVLAEREARFRAELEEKNELLVAEQARAAARRGRGAARDRVGEPGARSSALRRLVPADSAVGRRARALTGRLFARGSRRSAGPRG